MGKVFKWAAIALLVVLVLAGLLGALAVYRIESNAPRGEVTSPSGRLVCSRDAHMQYMQQVAEVGEMGLGLNATIETPADVDRLLAAYDAMALSGPQTVVVAAHVATGQTYQQTCAAERCTLAEMADPNRQCQTDHFNGCSYLALRFRSQDYCMIAPAQVSND
ncbi:MAG: hypothetical protein RLZZ437_3366 [Pseudomonadota bacterium]|jgi:hypothetical protein